MDKAEREQARRLVAGFKRWGRRAADVRAWRQAVRDAAGGGEKALRTRSELLVRDGRPAWRAVALGAGDLPAVARLWERALLPTGECRRPEPVAVAHRGDATGRR